MRDASQVPSYRPNGRCGILPEFTSIGLRDANAVLDAMAKGHSGKRSVITFG